MIVKRWLSRPRWEHRNASVRRESVAHDNDATLTSQLTSIARDDDDAGVRTAALRRVADLALAQERAHDDPDATVRIAAGALYLDLLGGGHPSAPPLADRLRLLRAIDDKVVWGHLLREGAEPALREAALDRDPRPGLLVERTLEDPDLELRLRLLARIDDTAALSRIADHARRRDKRLHRAARERLDALRLNAGDESALADAAHQLCRRLERAASGNATLGLSLDEADRAWNQLADRVNPALATRYTHARAQLQAATLAAASPAAMSPKIATANAEPESLHPSAPVEAPANKVQRLAAEVRFKASIASSLEQSAPRPKPQPVRDAGLEFRLQQLEQALDRGESRVVLESEQALLDSNIGSGKLAGRWRDARARSAELQRWQQWSTRRQRRQLCNDAAQLRDSALHPDALGTRVRELRGAWTKLDGLDTSNTQTETDVALNKRFQSLCHRALAPAKEYFDQRHNLRQQKNEQIRAVIDEVAAIEPDSDDWAAMTAMRKRLAAARRELGATEPRQRKQLSTALQASIEALDARLAVRHADVETAHERLIAEAGEVHALELSQRPRRVRELQSRWKQLGAGRPDLDRKQWQAFRRICNEVFAGLDEQRKRDAAEHEQAVAQARQLVSEFTALAESTNIDDLQRRRRELEASWRQLQVREPDLRKQWHAVTVKLEHKLLDLRQRAQRAQFEPLPAILAGAEPTPALLPELRAALARRPTLSADANDARDVLVRLEALADIDSPAADQERRVALRLQRLQAVLGEGRRHDMQTEFVDVLQAWIELGPVTDNEGTLETRFRRAFEAMLDKS